MIQNARNVRRQDGKGKGFGNGQTPSQRRAIQISFEIPRALPTLTAIAILCIFVISAIESMAGILPVISLAAFALCGFEALLARYAPRRVHSRWDIAAAFALISAIAASLSGPEHILSALGLAMVP
nr:MAG: hypothetical protein E4H34_04375 [Hyphomicrobiales bacterium]